MLYRLPGTRVFEVAVLCFLQVCFNAALVTADEDGAADGNSVSDEQRAFVQNKVLPLLEARCFECHGGTEGEDPEGGLVLTSRPTALTGGDSGAAIVPGKPDESLLVEAIRYESFEMPPRSRMPEPEIKILVDWIEMGAPWPADLQDNHANAAVTADFPLEERRAAHWSWQPIEDSPPPAVSDDTWPADPVDRFVMARLDAAGLTPATRADRRTLVRRLYFDLIGLPPSIEEMEAYINDPESDQVATATVVDRLLASEHFGERWARHWLDLVRYGETLGHEFDYPLRHAWQYRDYVIRAFNSDVPYDQFVREHVAGDLLQEPRRHPTEKFNESMIGTGFWHLHEDKHAPVDVLLEQAIKVDNQIDVFSRTFMGLTVACARCHDHKFDAIPTKDYYALYGILQSSRRRTGWLDRHQKVDATSQSIIALREQADSVIAQLAADDTANGTIRNYTLAATEVVRALAGSSNADAKAIVIDVAERRSCDPDMLQQWVDVLRNPETQKLPASLSLLARITQTSQDTDIASVTQQWSSEVLKAQADSGQTVMYADFSRGLPDGWTTTGPAFDGRTQRSTVAAAGPGPRLGSAGFSSADLSRRFRGSLYSPAFEITQPEILVRIAGEKTRVRLVIDGYVMMEFNPLLFRGLDHKVDTKGEFQWIRIAKDTHRYMGRTAYLEIMDEGDGWFVVDEVRFATAHNGAPPAIDIPMFQSNLAQRLKDTPTTDPMEAAAEFLWPSLFIEGLMPSSTSENWTILASKSETIADEAPRPFPVIAMAEGTGLDQSVFIRGNHKNKGTVASRAFLTAIAGSDQTPVENGSGRLELANRLLADDNPFPARVAVNRIWHHLFGRGIVASTDDFGVLGARPTHPELLDHLAVRFTTDGWSVKRLIRALVLTQTYQMQSVSSAKAKEQDPANTLLHSARIRRLQGEVIRDSMLQLAGHLDLKLFGAPVPVALTPFMEGRGRPKSGPLDGNGRRSIYISVNRNFLSPFMLAFDTPAPMSTRGRRSVSNVPAQALIMLNDEFAHQQAQRWADRLLSETQNTAPMITLAYEQALGRRPTTDELNAIVAFAQQQAKSHGESFADGTIGKKTIHDVCHAIMNTKEFIYIR